MAWLIQHKCNIGDEEVTPYSMIAGKLFDTGEKVTRVICPTCTEEFLIKGHDFFTEAHSTRSAGLALPPGFVIAKTRRA